MKFDSVEDVLQTFFSIARALYDAADEDDEEFFMGVLTATATVPGRGTMRIRVDYPEGAEDS